MRRCHSNVFVFFELLMVADLFSIANFDDIRHFGAVSLPDQIKNLVLMNQLICCQGIAQTSVEIGIFTYSPFHTLLMPGYTLCTPRIRIEYLEEYPQSTQLRDINLYPTHGNQGMPIFMRMSNKSFTLATNFHLPESLNVPSPIPKTVVLVHRRTNVI